MRLFSFRSPYSIIIWYIIAAGMCGAVVYSFGWVFAGVFGLLGAVYPLHAAVVGYGLSKELRLRGYEWVSLKTGYSLVIRHHSKAWRIPPHDEAASIPGYEDTLEGLERMICSGLDLPEPSVQLPEVQDWMNKYKRLPEPPPVPLAIRMTLTGRGMIYIFIIVNVLILIRIMESGWNGWNLLLINCFITPLWMASNVLFLRRHLRQLGYGAPTWEDAFFLGIRLQHLSWSIPRHEDVQRIMNTREPIGTGLLLQVMVSAYFHDKKKRSKDLLSV